MSSNVYAYVSVWEPAILANQITAFNLANPDAREKAIKDRRAIVEKNVTSHLSALRAIFLELLHSATAVTAQVKEKLVLTKTRPHWKMHFEKSSICKTNLENLSEN